MNAITFGNLLMAHADSIAAHCADWIDGEGSEGTLLQTMGLSPYDKTMHKAIRALYVTLAHDLMALHDLPYAQRKAILADRLQREINQRPTIR